MPDDCLQEVLAAELRGLEQAGRRKAPESVVTGVVPARGGRGPRTLLAGEGERPFLRLNSNGYLGLAFAADVMAAHHAATDAFGAGPGAVRFISGTVAPHPALERRLASFHCREAAIVFNSAYAAVLGTLGALISAETAVLSDALNHNSIINALRMARPAEKSVYRHLDLDDLGAQLGRLAGKIRRALIVTDGVFSMRGDHAQLAELSALARAHHTAFPEGVLLVVDDSHGVGAFGARGRGTEEHTGAAPADILIGTLGKAFGVNGGYTVASATVVEYLRQLAPTYVYSNPIGPGEAAAALQAVDIVDSPAGLALLQRLQASTARFRTGLTELGLETMVGQHPIVPLMMRDTARTAALVRHLHARGVLATGLTFPVVPKGDESIRFQISAEHTEADIDEVIAALAESR